mmetsp:Transcript_24517/g.77047  ORF Transcript_24517/g.77047 Transcript_24517/m.77047 type:complete len:225 (-) Transcript_24517:1421-2095(-)
MQSMLGMETSAAATSLSTACWLRRLDSFRSWISLKLQMVLSSTRSAILNEFNSVPAATSAGLPEPQTTPMTNSSRMQVASCIGAHWRWYDTPSAALATGAAPNESSWRSRPASAVPLAGATCPARSAVRRRSRRDQRAPPLPSGSMARAWVTLSKECAAAVSGLTVSWSTGTGLLAASTTTKTSGGRRSRVRRSRALSVLLLLGSSSSAWGGPASSLNGSISCA